MPVLRIAATDVERVYDRYAIGEFGVIAAASVGLGAPPAAVGSGNAALLDATGLTLQVADQVSSRGEMVWRAALDALGVAITARTGTNIPVSLTARFFRATAGTGLLKPMVQG
jgi:hypothetical protein